VVTKHKLCASPYSIRRDMSMLREGIIKKLEEFCLPMVLIQIILEFWIEVRFGPRSSRILDCSPDTPTSIGSTPHYLYFCERLTTNHLIIYDRKDKRRQFIKKTLPVSPLLDISQRIAIAIDTTSHYLYILEEKLISVWDLNSQYIRSIPLPLDAFKKTRNKACGHSHIKVEDEKIIYLTMEQQHQVCVLSLSDGTLVRKIGENFLGEHSPPIEWNGIGQFREPRGIAFDSKSLYICDSWNNRIQIWDKQTDQFTIFRPLDPPVTSTPTFKLFDHPNAILLSGEETTLYIGDSESVTICARDGIILQTLGYENADDDAVPGLGIVGDELFVSDFHRKQILIFRRMWVDDEPLTKETGKKKGERAKRERRKRRKNQVLEWRKKTKED